jgi:hypothetical protein
METFVIGAIFTAISGELMSILDANKSVCYHKKRRGTHNYSLGGHMKQLNNTLVILIALASSTTPAFAKTLTSSTSTQTAASKKIVTKDAEQAHTERAAIANPGIQMLLNIISHMPEGFYKLNKQAAAEHALINLDAFLQNSPNDMLKLSLTATAKKVVRILKSYNQAHTKRAKLAEVIRVEQGALAELALTAEELSVAQDALTKTTPLLYAAARTRNRPWGWYAAGGSAALVALLTAIAYKKGYGPKWAVLKMLQNKQEEKAIYRVAYDLLNPPTDTNGKPLRPETIAALRPFIQQGEQSLISFLEDKADKRPVDHSALDLLNPPTDTNGQPFRPTTMDQVRPHIEQVVSEVPAAAGKGILNSITGWFS